MDTLTLHSAWIKNGQKHVRFQQGEVDKSIGYYMVPDVDDILTNAISKETGYPYHYLKPLLRILPCL